MLHLSGTRSSSHGFSIVDLVVVLAIVGILSSVAFPMYQSYSLRVHRTEVRVALMDVAERMQKYYFENKTYTDDLLALGLNSSPYITANGRYSMRVDDNGGGGGACPIVNCFKLVAPAIGKQATDTDCAVFELNSVGIKTALAGGGSQNNKCW